MTCVNKSSEFFYSTHVLVCTSPVLSIVTMECIMWERIICTACPTVHLFVCSRNPDCVYTKFLKVIHFICKTFKVSTMECCNSRNIFIYTTITVVIFCITVIKTVCKNKVYVSIVPVKIITCNRWFLVRNCNIYTYWFCTTSFVCSICSNRNCFSSTDF